MLKFTYNRGTMGAGERDAVTVNVALGVTVFEAVTETVLVALAVGLTEEPCADACINSIAAATTKDKINVISRAGNNHTGQLRAIWGLVGCVGGELPVMRGLHKFRK
jgi:hypothetical protein